ncbi:cytochrome P450 [Astrocystis sublimbata]|nr:cytochrome P450 [Astrocystis sublimbata]
MPVDNYQICNKINLPKPTVSATSMQPVTGGPSFISMNGDEWKYWRSLFNPGFSTGAMLNNVSHVVDSVLIFREKLIQGIGNGMVSLDELTTKLSTETILRVTLDDDSKYQRASHVLPTALNRILSWHSFWDPRVLVNPLRPFVQEYNEYETKEERNSETEQQKPKTIKSATTLALEAYIDEQQGSNCVSKNVINERFATYAASQIRLFLFAGTDSTASTLVYVFHMLSKHPDWLRKVAAATLLKENPSLLNRYKLTLVVIKETLRVYAPVGTVRSGVAGVAITDFLGNKQPMDYAGANVPRPDEFLPERFLVGPDHVLYANQAAYRPFKQGPRNCIGQTLVWNELKVAIILTCQEFEIKDAYTEFEPIVTVRGDRAYQTDSGGQHPVNGYPCRVEWAAGE